MRKLLGLPFAVALLSAAPVCAQNISKQGPSATGIAATGQIPGTATNDAASAGNLGEEGEVTVTSGSPVAITTTAVQQNITSQVLTAGDYEVSGLCNFIPASGATQITAVACAVNSTSGTLPANDHLASYTAAANNNNATVTVPPTRFSFGGGGGTIYLIGRVSFTVAGENMYGYLHWRRAR